MGWSGCIRVCHFPPSQPTTNILAPSFENAMPAGSVSCAVTLNEWACAAVETLNGVVRVYSCMAFLPSPTTNILAPSFENTMPDGPVSCAVTLNEWANAAVETSKVPIIRLPEVSRTLRDRSSVPARAVRDCFQTRPSQVKRYGTGICRGDKLACSQGYAAGVTARLPYVYPGRNYVCRRRHVDSL